MQKTFITLLTLRSSLQEATRMYPSLVNPEELITAIAQLVETKVSAII